MYGLRLPLRSPICYQVGGEALPGSLMLSITTASGAPAQGRLEAEHLADHPAAVRELQEAVAVGAKLGPLLVLERLEVCCPPLRHVLCQLLHDRQQAASNV